jgi:hypothetical protein
VWAWRWASGMGDGIGQQPKVVQRMERALSQSVGSAGSAAQAAQMPLSEK